MALTHFLFGIILVFQYIISNKKSPRQETRAFTRGTTLINGKHSHSLSQVRDYSDTRLSLKGKSLLTLLALAFVEPLQGPFTSVATPGSHPLSWLSLDA